MERIRDGRRYTSGRVDPSHRAWCTALAIVTRSLKNASSASGRSALTRAAQVLNALKPCFLTAFAGGETLEALRDQNTVIRFFEVASTLSDAVLGDLDLIQPLQLALQRVCDVLLGTSTEIQVILTRTPPPSQPLKEGLVLVVLGPVCPSTFPG